MRLESLTDLLTGSMRWRSNKYSNSVGPSFLYGTMGVMTVATILYHLRNKIAKRYVSSTMKLLSNSFLLTCAMQRCIG